MKKGWKTGGRGRGWTRKKYLHEGEQQHASDPVLLPLMSYRTIPVLCNLYGGCSAPHYEQYV